MAWTSLGAFSKLGELDFVYNLTFRIGDLHHPAVILETKHGSIGIIHGGHTRHGMIEHLARQDAGGDFFAVEHLDDLAVHDALAEKHKRRLVIEIALLVIDVRHLDPRVERLRLVVEVSAFGLRGAPDHHLDLCALRKWNLRLFGTTGHGQK